MLRSMFTAIGGLRNHQVMLDVTANNIANVNTVGYKAQRVNFEAMMSQTLRGASSPVTDGVGGSGPTQVGLGMQLGGIGSLLTQGSMQSTGQWSDIAVSGEGYFMVGDNLDPTTGQIISTTPPAAGDTNLMFTRAGNFTTDRDGNLVTQDGHYVLGLKMDNTATPPVLGTALGKIQIPTDAQSVGVDKNGNVTVVQGSGPVIIGQIQLAKFPNDAGLQRMSGNKFQESQNSGAPTVLAPGVSGAGLITPGAVEMSNVDLAQEFTNMITAQRGFQANSRVISAADEMLQELVNLKR